MSEVTSSGVASKVEEKCNAIRFSDFCKLLEKMSKASGSQRKLSLLFSRELKTYLQGQSLFPLLRLLLPINDTERGKYGLKQAAIAKTYVAALHLDKNSEDARRLVDWKDPTKNLTLDPAKLITGDFGLILEDVLSTRVRQEPSVLTLGEVNALLDSLANATSTEEKITIIRSRVLNEFNAMEQKWLARIIFQDLKVGLQHEAVLKRLYPTALQRYNECTNLRVVCEEEGSHGKLQGIQLFTPFSPMLAKGFPTAHERLLSTVESAMVEQPFVMDLKIDGERILCHVGDDNSFVMYTRNANDYTENYWPVAHNVITCLRKRVSTQVSCILDGEVCAIDKESLQLLPFGCNMTVAKTEREYGENKQDRVDWHTDLSQWMVFIIFDVVYLAGEGSEDLMAAAWEEHPHLERLPLVSGEISSYPLAVRRSILRRLLEPEPHRVEIVPHRLVDATDRQLRLQQLEEYFNEIVGAGKEGLVLKQCHSTYEFGERSRIFSYWVKVKPEYGAYVSDLDVLVLAAYYGEGKSMRGKGISTFLCGVVDDSNRKIYQTLCKVGTGYSFAQLASLRERLMAVASAFDAKSPPPHFAAWKIAKRDDIPDVFFPPDQSVVLQIKCAELVPSTSFSCGLTCRFPRVQRIREDKDCDGVLTLRELLEIKNTPRTVTVSAQQADEADEANGGGKRRRRTAKQDPKQSSATRGKHVEEQFLVKPTTGGGAHDDRRARDDNLFKDRVFCLVDNEYKMTSSQYSSQDLGIRQYTKQQIIAMIRDGGGQVVANATVENCLVVAGSKKTVSLKNIIAQGLRDVIDFSYLIDCVDAGQALPLKRYYYLSYSPQTKRLFEGQYDIFGDSYVEEVTPQELGKLLQSAADAIQLLSASSSAKLSTPSRGKSTPQRQGMEMWDNGASAAEISSALDSWKQYVNLSWKAIMAAEDWDATQRQSLRHAMSALYDDQIVVYFDVFDSLGICSGESRFGVESLDFSSVDVALSPDAVMRLRCAAVRAAARGAVLADSLHEHVTHVVVHRQAFAAHDLALRIQRVKVSYLFSAWAAADRRALGRRGFLSCHQDNDGSWMYHG